MYEYRIFFPRVGSTEIRREITARVSATERRRREAVAPEPRVSERHDGKERA